MKKSFTMIELIFVIVILGILAAVAIPKLAATRDDAETAKLTNQVQNAMKEMISYYTSQGGEINFSKIEKAKTSQIVFNDLISHGWVDVKDDNHSVLFSNKDTKRVCMNVYTNGYEIQIDINDSDDSTLCKDIGRVVEDRNYSILNSIVNF